MSEEEEEEKPYWERTGSKSSQRLFLTFIAVVVIMLIIIVSLSIFSYMKWQDLKERPKIRAKEGLFDFGNATDDGRVRIEVVLTLVNKGEEKSQDLELEWIIMDERKSRENIFFKRGTTNLSPLSKSETRKVRFNITLPPNEYIISYRTYEDDIFSYEGRQYFRVTETDTAKERPGGAGADEGAGADSGTPMVPVTIFLAIAALIAVFKRYSKREENS